MELKTSLEMVVIHWTKPIKGLHISPTEFYAKLDGKLDELEIPHAKLSRKWWKEAFFLSAKREYFRVERNRCVFDICCAPFGKGSFISSWLCIVPFCLSFMHILGMFSLQYIVLMLTGPGWWDPARRAAMWEQHGILFFIVTVISLVSTGMALIHLPIWWFFCKRRRQAVMINSGPVMDLLCGMTLLGPLLMMWADSKPTYYQIDSASVFHEAVHDVTMELLGEYMAAQDLPLLTEEERAPVLREFIKKS